MKIYSAEIKIMLKKGILDVQGKTIENSLNSMEFKELHNVRIGKFVELTCQADNEESAKTIIDQACSKLIANPIIEDYHISIQEVKGE
jgi:phosphoribosylformylglycinamidine synthase